MSQLEGLDLDVEAGRDTSPSEGNRAALAATATSAALAACGGGGGGSGGGGGIALAALGNTQPAATTAATATAADTGPTAGIPVPGSPIVAGAATTTYTAPSSDKDAARFLSQASPGASKAQITAMRGTSYAAWIDAQFALPRTQGHYDWLISKGYGGTNYLGRTDGLDNSIWRKLIASPDLLRQRVALALSEIFVVSVDPLAIWYPQLCVGTFLDLLEANAFGNYRTLLTEVSTSMAMGMYLTFAGNQLANPATGSQPDENYARESMQLFTIGLYKLNNDGTPVLEGGAPVETYNQADVAGLARVFTGWIPDVSAGERAPITFNRPMLVLPSISEEGEKKFLGTTIPAGPKTAENCRASMRLALDTLFNHPNAPPFVSKQLIQRMVTSNPSPSYVDRVAKAFSNNGSGVRGDMKAVIKAILLDDEARNPTIASTIAFGKLREPVMRFTNWARAVGATSTGDGWGIGNLSDSASALAQSPSHSPSVFNFFRPGFVPPNSELAKLGLAGPEFQITNESSVSSYVNFMQLAVSGQGVGDLRANYASLSALAADSSALLDEINLLLAAGQLSAATITTLKTALDTISATNDTGKLNRVYAALTLVLASPEYIVQK